MMKAQIIGGLSHDGIEHRIALEAKNVVSAVVLRPFHGFDTAVMTVAAPNDPGIGPVLAQAPRHMLDDGAHLSALRRARRA